MMISSLEKIFVDLSKTEKGSAEVFSFFMVGAH